MKCKVSNIVLSIISLGFLLSHNTLHANPRIITEYSMSYEAADNILPANLLAIVKPGAQVGIERRITTTDNLITEDRRRLSVFAIDINQDILSDECAKKMLTKMAKKTNNTARAPLPNIINNVIDDFGYIFKILGQFPSTRYRELSEENFDRRTCTLGRKPSNDNSNS